MIYLHEMELECMDRRRGLSMACLYIVPSNISLLSQASKFLWVVICISVLDGNFTAMNNYDLFLVQ
jgi:hypothetical protein